MDIEITILLISFFITVALSIIIIPILKKLKVGQIERSDGPQSHLKKQGTPTMGGIIMIISILIVSTIVSIYCVKIGEKDLIKKFLPVVFILIGYGIIGFIDDFKKMVLKNTTGLKPAFKMIGLLLISVIYVLFLIATQNDITQTYIPLFKIYINIPTIIYIPVAIFIILATTNAVNLTDGVDGLASSVCTIIVTLLIILGIKMKMPEVSIIGATVVGAVLGFLMFNLYPSKVMMGDTGSLFLGGIISGLALYLKVPLIIPIIAIIPVLETISVMIQVRYFQKTGNRIFKMAPLHHHFELSGWKENKVVMVFSVVTLIACVLTLFII